VGNSSAPTGLLGTRQLGELAELTDGKHGQKIAAFAEKAKQPFAGSASTPTDDYEEQLYEEFWHEYD
jgi:hypothetical protein